MSMRSLRFLAAALLCLAPAPGLAGGMVEEQRAMAADGTVTVSNVAGDIVISTWDRAEIRVVAELGTNQELEITETSRGISVAVINTGGRDDYDESDLELVVPVGASIMAEGVSADITIRGARGKSISAETVSGDVGVSAEIDRAELSSVSGDIEFEGASMRTTAESVSGDIDLEGIAGEISISTVSGDASVQAGRVQRGHFESVSGTLQLELAAAEGGRITVESMNGDVIMTLPDGQHAEFILQTFSGDIESAWGRVRQEDFGPGSRLKHVEGQSGTLIRVESFSGDIEIGHK